MEDRNLCDETVSHLQKSIKAVTTGHKLNENWVLYGSAGEGFHSNDARGTTIRLDPVDGGMVERVDPLVESLGGEVGARAFWTDRLNASVALWYLELDSELLFVGDAGNTEATRASERLDSCVG